MSGPHFMVCARSENPAASYRCKVCDAPLQISQDGFIRMVNHPEIALLCNACGLDFAQAIAKRLEADPNFGATVVFHEEAQKQVREREPGFADWLDANAEKKRSEDI